MTHFPTIYHSEIYLQRRSPLVSCTAIPEPGLLSGCEEIGYNVSRQVREMSENRAPAIVKVNERLIPSLKNTV